MNQDQEKKIFEVIGKLYFNSILSDEQINFLNARISKLQQEVLLASQKGSDNLSSVFIDTTKFKEVIVDTNEK